MIQAPFTGRVLLGLCACWLATGLVTQADEFPSTSISQGSDFGSNRYNGVKRSLYYVIRDSNDPFTQPEWDSRIEQIRVNESFSREFFSENSGGKFDIYFSTILDVPLALNDGARPSDWRNIVKQYAADTLGFNGISSLNDYYYANFFDVNQTDHPPGENFTGFYHGGNDISLESLNSSTTNPNTYGQRTLDHEIGHRVSLNHAHAYRTLSDSTHTPYVWNSSSQQYEEYVPGSSPFNATPYGMEQREYGNPFDNMGHGTDDALARYDFNVTSKRGLGWLTSAQVPNLDVTGEGTYRIYAHDELNSTSTPNVSHGGNTDDIYGVQEGYNSSVLYGLSFNRIGERFNSSTGLFDPDFQTVAMEYRAGQNGIGFYIDGVLIDLDPAGGSNDNSQARLLNVGQAVEDIAFGMSTFHVTSNNVDFLSFNPPAPTDTAELRDEWYHFNVLNTGSDAIGSFIEVQVTEVMGLNGIAGDLDQQNGLTQADFDLFIAGWRSDTSQLTSPEKYLRGDMNFDGITDLNDAWLFHQAWKNADLGASPFAGLSIPEPSSLLMMVSLGLVGLGIRQRVTPKPLRRNF